MLRKRQSRKIFVEIIQTMFRKVQRTEISFVKDAGALHLKKFVVSISTNIRVLCTCLRNIRSYAHSLLHYPTD